MAEDVNPGPHTALDQAFRAALARACASLSPQSTLMAWLDWASHLAVSPGKQMELSRLAAELAQSLAWSAWRQGASQAGALGVPVAAPAAAGEAARADAPASSGKGEKGGKDVKGGKPGPAAPAPDDRRFRDPAWQNWPFSLWRQVFHANQQWWEAATQGVKGVSDHHQQVVAFGARQWLDLWSPGNFLATNPVALQRTVDEGGANLLRGAQYWLENQQARVSGRKPASGQFVVGRDVAVTPGKVVLRTPLMELIQYAPTTAKVRPEPVLIVPAWIMKYYILDLSPHNSLIKYLVDQGHTVFCISWKNPDASLRDQGMDDYLSQGFFAALDAVQRIVPGQRAHATGYCLGGTLLAIAAAAMARDGQLERLASLTLFAAQTDFSEPGELGLFIDESQIALLEAQMAEKGYLRADQMAGAFQMLRSYDLLWSRMVSEYLMGERMSMNDLMAWNADATRMPATMQSQYLRRLFLDNDLSQGRYPVDGRPVSVGSLSLPIFCVGTLADHVAPWRSVYKLHNLAPAEITFVLTSGGHNAGIVSEPGRPRRHFQLQVRPAGGAFMPPEEWLQSAPQHEGSWWPQWADWLRARSGKPVPPPGLGSSSAGYPPLEDAPGRYVKERG